MVVFDRSLLTHSEHLDWRSFSNSPLFVVPERFLNNNNEWNMSNHEFN